MMLKMNVMSLNKVISQIVRVEKNSAIFKYVTCKNTLISKTSECFISTPKVPTFGIKFTWVPPHLENEEPFCIGGCLAF